MDKLQERTDKGFTLLEVLVAVTIFAIGLLAVASMQTNATTGNSFSQRHTAATAVAQGALESVMALPSNNALFDAAVIGAAYDLDPLAAGTTLMVNGGTYTATLNITPNVPATNVATVVINLTGPGTPAGGILVTGYKRTS
jgi:type IV pilus assembly protein PilV